MITVRGVDVRVGARLLLSDLSFHVSPGDRIGLVGRNGAGKTTLLSTLAGQDRPATGSVSRTGPVSYLPQDPRAADPAATVTDRILSARGLDRAVRALRAAETALADGSERAMNTYVRAEAEFQSRGGYAAEAEAARVAAGLGLPARVMDQPIGTLSGGQRRRVERSRKESMWCFTSCRDELEYVGGRGEASFGGCHDILVLIEERPNVLNGVADGAATDAEHIGQSLLVA